MRGLQYDWRMLRKMGTGVLGIKWVRILVIFTIAWTAVIAWARHVHWGYLDFVFHHFGSPPFVANVWVLVSTLLAFLLGFLQDRANRKFDKVKLNLSIIGHSMEQLFEMVILNEKGAWSERSVAARSSHIAHTVLVREALNLWFACFCCDLNYLSKAYCEQHFVRQFMGMPASSEAMRCYREMERRISSSKFSPNQRLVRAGRAAIVALLMRERVKAKASLEREEVEKIDDAFRTCMELHNDDGVPPNQVQLLEVGLLFQIFTIPLPMVAAMHWWALPASAIVIFLFTGVFFATMETLEPFGRRDGILRADTEGKSTVIDLLDLGHGISRRLNDVVIMEQTLRGHKELGEGVEAEIKKLLGPVWDKRKVQEYEDGVPELWVDTDIRWSKERVLGSSSEARAQSEMHPPVAANAIDIHLKQ